MGLYLGLYEISQFRFQNFLFHTILEEDALNTTNIDWNL